MLLNEVYVSILTFLRRLDLDAVAITNRRLCTLVEKYFANATLRLVSILVQDDVFVRQLIDVRTAGAVEPVGYGIEIATPAEHVFGSFLRVDRGQAKIWLRHAFVRCINCDVDRQFTDSTYYRLLPVKDMFA